MSKNNEKKGKATLLEFLSVKAELPSDALAGETRIELRGRKSSLCSGLPPYPEIFSRAYLTRGQG